MPPEQPPLTEQEAHERAVTLATADLRRRFTEAMRLLDAEADLLLNPWDQSGADMLAYVAYRARFGIPERERAPSLAEVGRLAERTRCRFCAKL